MNRLLMNISYDGRFVENEVMMYALLILLLSWVMSIILKGFNILFSLSQQTQPPYSPHAPDLLSLQIPFHHPHHFSEKHVELTYHPEQSPRPITYTEYQIHTTALTPASFPAKRAAKCFVK